MGVIVRLVRKMNDALGISSILVSHDVQEVGTVADQSFLLSEGKVVASGSPDELSNTSSELVRQFMHGMADGPVAFHLSDSAGFACATRGGRAHPRRRYANSPPPSSSSNPLAGSGIATHRRSSMPKMSREPDTPFNSNVTLTIEAPASVKPWNNTPPSA